MSFKDISFIRLSPNSLDPRKRMIARVDAEDLDLVRPIMPNGEKMNWTLNVDRTWRWYAAQHTSSRGELHYTTTMARLIAFGADDGLVRAVREGVESTLRKNSLDLRFDYGSDSVGGYVEHINGDGLDNRKQNLRVIAPHSGHMRNANPMHLPRGVFWDPRWNAWGVNYYTPVNNRVIEVGHFDSVDAAVTVFHRIEFEEDWRGEFDPLIAPMSRQWWVDQKERISAAAKVGIPIDDDPNDWVRDEPVYTQYQCDFCKKQRARVFPRYVNRYPDVPDAFVEDRNGKRRPKLRCDKCQILAHEDFGRRKIVRMEGR